MYVCIHNYLYVCILGVCIYILLNVSMCGCRDAGCGSKSIPFSAVNLSLVASKVAALMGPAVFNIYIASDDYVWVTEQIEIMKGESPQWNFFIIPPPVIGRGMYRLLCS